MLHDLKRRSGMNPFDLHLLLSGFSLTCRKLKMAHDSSTRGAKRKMAASFPDPSSRSFKVSLLSSSLLLLEIPPGTNTSLPVWDAIRSQQVDISWTVEPYSISVHFTPVTSTQGKSTTSGESTSVAETSALPSVILNPQIQPTTQGNGTSPNTSCVLISLPKNSTQFLLCPPRQPQATPPKSGTVMRTQAQPAHQLSIPKMQALSKTPVPSPFHTKNSSEVRICDRFLLNMCQEGDKCKMHHTPFPFHWQLWCVTTHQWVSISTHSQVLLERIYCDVSHDVVHINDGWVTGKTWGSRVLLSIHYIRFLVNSCLLMLVCPLNDVEMSTTVWTLTRWSWTIHLNMTPWDDWQPLIRTPTFPAPGKPTGGTASSGKSTTRFFFILLHVSI